MRFLSRFLACQLLFLFFCRCVRTKGKQSAQFEMVIITNGFSITFERNSSRQWLRRHPFLPLPQTENLNTQESVKIEKNSSLLPNKSTKRPGNGIPSLRTVSFRTARHFFQDISWSNSDLARTTPNNGKLSTARCVFFVPKVGIS